MTVPEWLPLVAAGVAIVVWRRIVLRGMRSGLFGPRYAAAIYAALIPFLVLLGFVLGDRFGPVAMMYAAIGFALSYAFALLVFRRADAKDRDRS